MLLIFIALYKINCSNELGFMAIPSQFSCIRIFIVAAPRQREKMNRLKCLTNSLETPTSNSLCLSDCQGQLHFFV